MKKYLIILALVLAPLAGYSQSIFDKFEDMDDVTSVIINQNMFDLLAKMDVNSDEPEMDIAKSLKGLKVFVTENKGISTQMKSTVDQYLRSASLEELMRVKDKDANVKFYIRKGKDEDHVSELLMFITGIKNTDMEINDRKIETVLLSLTGDIDLTKIGEITRKMNLPEELNQIEKKKS